MRDYTFDNMPIISISGRLSRKSDSNRVYENVLRIKKKQQHLKMLLPVRCL
ncbi:MAG: hypothetical protein KBT40_01060 [bacterium]|nr:hypothetical protein [Candidatus Minthenecus merdequi]